jgi:hypothetical protein
MPYINNLNHFVEVVDTLRQGMLRVAQMASAGASAHNEAQRINNDNQMMDEQVSKDRAELDQQKKEFADNQKEFHVPALCQQIAELAADKAALQRRISLLEEAAAGANNKQVDNEEHKDESESKEEKKDSSNN